MMNNKDNKVSVLFMLFSILFCVCLIAANVLETKQIAFGKISLTGGLIVFPVSYIINDCVCEVWGYKKARLLIWTGFAMNFFFVSLGAICDAIPGASYWTNAEGFHAVFGLAPRIAFASFLAFVCGSFVNAYIMSKMKLSSGGKNFSLRAVGRCSHRRVALVDALAGDFEDRLRDCCVAVDHPRGTLCEASRTS